MTPSRTRTSCIRLDSIFRPWSLCSSIGTPKRHKKQVSRASATVQTSLLDMAYTSGHFVNSSMAIRRYLFPLSLSGEGPEVNSKPVNGFDVLVHQAKSFGSGTSAGGTGDC